MPELLEGFELMLLGMGIVFVFLILLMFFMKIIPILSRLRKSKDKKSSKSRINDNKDRIKLTAAMGQIKESKVAEGDLSTKDQIPEAVVAAIATAIFSHTGKKPMQLVITAPGATPQQYNIWGVAGRQDQMLARDMAGQVGFQY